MSDEILSPDSGDLPDEFKFELEGLPMYTGNIVPETFPLTFKPFPEKNYRSLDDVWEIMQSRQYRIREHLGPKSIWSQGRRGSCNAYMAARMISTLMWRATGEWIKLSPEFIYMHINGGKDQGSGLAPGMKFASDQGCPEFMQMFYEKYRKSEIKFDDMGQAAGSAKLHRFGECYQCPKDSEENCWRSIISGIAGRGVAGIALHVGSNFQRSGKVAGVDRGPGNHAVMADDLVSLTDGKPRSWADIGIDMANSWGRRWADGGRAVVTIKHIIQPMKYHGLYVARSTLVNPERLEDIFALAG